MEFWSDGGLKRGWRMEDGGWILTGARGDNGEGKRDGEMAKSWRAKSLGMNRIMAGQNHGGSEGNEEAFGRMWRTPRASECPPYLWG
jgi:hypothetical protein